MFCFEDCSLLSTDLRSIKPQFGPFPVWMIDLIREIDIITDVSDLLSWHQFESSFPPGTHQSIL